MEAKIKVDIKDNLKEVLSEFQKQIALALESIGSTAEGYAKDECPVDTGRLRNSITYSTKDFKGIDEYEDNNGKKFSGGSAKATPEKNAVYIGTNVEYAPAVEYRDIEHKHEGRAHFLRDAATTHNDEYKEIAEKILKGDL